jgi:hypothetical protein
MGARRAAWALTGFSGKECTAERKRKEEKRENLSSGTETEKAGEKGKKEGRGKEGVWLAILAGIR